MHIRRGICGLLVGLLLCVGALGYAEGMEQVTDAIFGEVQARMPGKVPGSMEFAEAGDWFSAAVQFSDADYTQWLGLVYDTQAQAFLTWDALFDDGDGAAAHLEGVAADAIYDNAYAEHNEVAPIPRDNFFVGGNMLRVYYPPEQLSYFSGRAGALSFYAYELEGLLRADVPITRGDRAQARQTLDAVLRTGTLPAPLDWQMGTQMAQADTALTLVDVPDIREEYAIWHFEAPEMRGAALLSDAEDRRVETATVTGVYAERFDFSGLCPGQNTRPDCVDALGEPDRAERIETADAYSRLPVGESLVWSGDAVDLSLHFVDDVLHSLTLSAR